MFYKVVKCPYVSDLMYAVRYFARLSSVHTCRISCSYRILYRVVKCPAVSDLMQAVGCFTGLIDGDVRWCRI